MTKQELHEKIINIIKENGVYNGKSMHRDYYVVNDEELADALIEAGLRFGENLTATFDHMTLEREHDLEHRLAEAEHHAEVAERALVMACANMAKDEKSDVNIECVIRVLYYKYLKQAENNLRRKDNDSKNQ